MTTAKVYQAIAAITAAMSHEGISKARKNQQQGYSFRGIDGFPTYRVTECGRVYSDASDKFLTPRKVNGYHLVTIGGRNGRQVSVHVLVATAFHGARPDGHVVNHKNGVRTDNRSANLEWVTQSENVQHAYKTGLRVIDDAHKNRAAALGRGRRSFTDDQSESIRSAYTGMRGQITALANQHGISRYAVANIIGGLK